MTASTPTLKLSALAMALSLALMPSTTPTHAQTPSVVAPSSSATPGIYQLDQFGPIDSPQNAQTAFDKASQIISATGGGILIIPKSTPTAFKTQTAPQPMLRVPNPPAPAAKWGTHPGVSVYDLRTPDTFYTAQTSGIKIQHQLYTPPGQTLPIGQDASLGAINNQILRGTSSYTQNALSHSPAGEDKSVSVPSIQGLFPGQTLTFGPKSSPGTLTVKSLAFDNASKAWSITGDLSKPLAKGDLLQCITRTGVLNLTTLSNNENQTFDMMVWHHTFANSSRNLVKASFKYQGDNIPSSPEKGTVLFGATTNQLVHPFEGHVESFDPQSGALVYKSTATATNTIGSGRPIINMNPAKQIKAKANLYSGDWTPIHIIDGPPITKDVNGWYIAIDEPGEAVPGTSARRWFPIAGVDKPTDGQTKVWILRYWWGAHAGRGLGNLYSNLWSSKETQIPVNVILAPGANVFDASDAVQKPEKNLDNPNRLIKLAPSPMNGTPNDFDPGDPITQAIGPDPWHPAIFRSWLFESVPGIGPTPLFDIQNIGPIPRGSVMHVRGGSRYNTMFSFQAPAPIGIHFRHEIPEGALILNAPPDTAKTALANAIVFTFPDADKKTSAAGLTTDQSGRIKLWSKDYKGVTLANQPITGVTGLNSESGNFRALALPVPQGQTSHQLTFPKPEPSDQYALILRPNWITNYAVQTKTPQGVTIIFDKPAPKDATIDWLLIR